MKWAICCDPLRSGGCAIKCPKCGIVKTLEPTTATPATSARCRCSIFSSFVRQRRMLQRRQRGGVMQADGGHPPAYTPFSPFLRLSFRVSNRHLYEESLVPPAFGIPNHLCSHHSPRGNRSGES